MVTLMCPISIPNFIKIQEVDQNSLLILPGMTHITNQKSIERIQRRATKLISNIRHYMYQERIQVLNLPSLYHWWLREDMILLYQITHGHTDKSLLDFFIPTPSTTTRGHNYKLCKPRYNSRCRGNFSLIGLLINGTVYLLILLMLIQLIVSKTYWIIFGLTLDSMYYS